MQPPMLQRDVSVDEWIPRVPGPGVTTSWIQDCVISGICTPGRLPDGSIADAAGEHANPVHMLHGLFCLLFTRGWKDKTADGPGTWHIYAQKDRVMWFSVELNGLFEVRTGESPEQGSILKGDIWSVNIKDLFGAPTVDLKTLPYIKDVCKFTPLKSPSFLNFEFRVRLSAYRETWSQTVNLARLLTKVDRVLEMVEGAHGPDGIVAQALAIKQAAAMSIKL